MYAIQQQPMVSRVQPMIAGVPDGSASHKSQFEMMPGVVQAVYPGSMMMGGPRGEQVMMNTPGGAGWGGIPPAAYYAQFAAQQPLYGHPGFAQAQGGWPQQRQEMPAASPLAPSSAEMDNQDDQDKDYEEEEPDVDDSDGDNDPDWQAPSRHARATSSTKKSKKTHACTICDRVFSCSSNLNRHMRVHTGEKPYKCSQCGVAFANSSNRNKHEERCGLRSSPTKNLSRPASGTSQAMGAPPPMREQRQVPVNNSAETMGSAAPREVVCAADGVSDSVDVELPVRDAVLGRCIGTQVTPDLLQG